MAHDDRHIPRPGIGRRAALKLLGTTALGTTAVGSRLHAVAAAAPIPSCVVRPEQIEGPFFVDEKLNRSDIRSDPGTGMVKDGAPLALEFRVSRIDGSACLPLAGLLVDIWQTDAAGEYSDVVDTGFNTVGQQFLRGYQVTDADGVATFVTIYPGWYPGRTVHIHFKLRTAAESGPTFAFTSQLYFDDDLTDTVHAQSPYAAHGERTLRNTGDAFYQNGGSSLRLDVASDGGSGYTASFDIGLQLTGTSTTTTTLPPVACATIADCLDAVEATLPVQSVAPDRSAKRVALRLRRRFARVARALDRAEAATGDARRVRQFAKARAGLTALLAVARDADAAGTLGAVLSEIEAAVAALLASLPA